MIRGLYIGASGMTAQQHRLDALSNNLANVDVNGYKRDVSAFKAFPELLIRRMNDDGVYKFPLGSSDMAPVVGKIGTGVEYNESYTVFEQGSFKETGNPYDVALEDKGFFAVQTPNGIRYTRNGAFTLGKEGFLVTKDGYQVLGENGPISVKLNNFKIDEQGRIFHNLDYAEDPERLVSMRENEWENMELLDTLMIVRFPRDRFIKKEGNGFWRETVDSGEAFTLDFGDRPKVQQGFLETSNVSPVKEMVRMIEVNRAYEANQKTIQTQDNLLGKLINEVSRFR
jgi:flagellar basal-body rod protein FlgF